MALPGQDIPLIKGENFLKFQLTGNLWTSSCFFRHTTLEALVAQSVEHP